MLDHIHWDNGLTINLSISIVIIVGVFSTSNVYVMGLLVLLLPTNVQCESLEHIINKHFKEFLEASQVKYL